MHIKLHDRICNEACQMPGCTARFVTRRLLDNHMKEQHQTYKQYRSALVTHCYFYHKLIKYHTTPVCQLSLPVHFMFLLITE